MSLMELIIRVFKIKSRDLLIFTINTFIILLFYYLFFKDSETLYPLILSITVIIVYFIIEVISYKKFIEKLEDSKVSPDYNNADINYREEEILSVISDVHKHYLNDIYTLKQEVRNRDIVFSKWIHNMKTSITVIDLACEKSNLDIGSNKYTKDIKEENNMLKKNLEECLNVIRLDDFSRDYVTGKCNLSELINNVVNLKKRDFIYKGVFPSVSIDKNISVYTDKKWCGYMLEQIISNAIKYSENEKGNKIEIFAIEEKEVIKLSIKDRGLGIREGEISRIFDPFFTGSNGREDRNATGIGLYMVKIIGEKLGHSVEIESEVGVGTTVKIIFRNESII
ncbi:sensor histidine kinase [Clostridium sardiniense]|uniref:sensor histidine kinase n=1 Tax=Clostridium sardiniense TaxID=29369 RepID=UPI003D32ADB5